jgi:SAM-dependent methyltransferase
MKLAHKISKFNRGRKYNYFLQKINPLAKDKILDIGFTDNEYSEEANYLEKHYPYRDNITALGLENSGNFNTMFPEVTIVTYDGNCFPFTDKTFDIGWSNAVIEHVGNREKQVLFVKEMLRTCHLVFFTTPNKFFPFDLHTQLPIVHWLPKKLFDRILHFIGWEWATGDYMNLLSKKQIISICKEAEAKNIIIKRNRFIGFTMDFSIIIH